MIASSPLPLWERVPTIRSMGGGGGVDGTVLATLQPALGAEKTGAVDAQVHSFDLHSLESVRGRRGACGKLAVAADQGDDTVRRRQRRRCGAAAGVRSPRG